MCDCAKTNENCVHETDRLRDTVTYHDWEMPNRSARLVFLSGCCPANADAACCGASDASPPSSDAASSSIALPPVCAYAGSAAGAEACAASGPPESNEVVESTSGADLAISC